MKKQETEIPVLENPSVKSISRTIAKDYPSLKIESVDILDHGWDNVVAEVNDELIFRFPREDGSNLDLETKVLNILKDKVHTTIPEISYLGKSAQYIGYKKIQGKFLTSQDWDAFSPEEKDGMARELARFVWDIHQAITPIEAKTLGVEDDSMESVDEDSYQKHIQELISLLRDPELIAIARETLNDIQSYRSIPPDTVFLYNDLHTENFVYDPKTKHLNGVFDFGDIAVGDVHLDFLQLYKFDPDLLRMVVDEYERLSKRKLSMSRIIAYAKVNELCDLKEFFDKPESSVYKNAIERLKRWSSLAHWWGSWIF